MRSIVEAVKNHSSNKPEKIALACGGMELSYYTLFENAKAFACNIKLRNIKKGSRIVLEASDLLLYFSAYLGCALAGCIAVPVEENVSIYKLQNILKAVKPALIFMKNNGESYEDFFVQKGDMNFRLPKAEWPVSLVSTTGTTGSPVLVTHTNKSVVATVENLSEGINLEETDVVFSNLPFYLSVGIRRVCSSLAKGATAVLYKGDLCDEALTENIDKYGVNHIAIGNTSLKVLLDTKSPELKRAMGNVRGVESLSGPLSSINIRDFHKLYPDSTLYNVYGTTESGCLIINNTGENSAEGCLGKPACNSEIFLLDENGEKVTKAGVYGHIAVKGDMNMLGYYRKKALTDEVMQKDHIVINDIAYFDADGYFYFVSRVGDIIDVKGNKIIPEEIENIISTFKGVSDCAFICVRDERENQVPVLYITTNDEFNEGEFMGFLEKNLERYKIPDKIIHTQSIPKTSTGKIMRKALEMNKI